MYSPERPCAQTTESAPNLLAEQGGRRSLREWLWTQGRSNTLASRASRATDLGRVCLAKPRFLGAERGVTEVL